MTWDATSSAAFHGVSLSGDRPQSFRPRPVYRSRGRRHEPLFWVTDARPPLHAQPLGSPYGKTCSVVSVGEAAQRIPKPERDPFEISVRMASANCESRRNGRWEPEFMTFVARLGKGKYLEYLLTYYSHTGRLDFTPGQGDRPFQTLAEAAGQPNSRGEAFRCLSCHTTGSVDSRDTDDIRVGELGVRCEACHAPGLLHLEAVKREDWDEARRQIRNPGRSTAAEVLRLCGSCHREPPADASWSTGRIRRTRFQPVGLSRSRCFLQSDGIFHALRCHDSYADVRRAESRFYSDICARCHHPAKLPPAARCSAPDCAGCHMPRVQAIRHMEFANHWIGIYSSSNRLVPAR
jgi:hypothetical protein